MKACCQFFLSLKANHTVTEIQGKKNSHFSKEKLDADMITTRNNIEPYALKRTCNVKKREKENQGEEEKTKGKRGFMKLA